MTESIINCPHCSFNDMSDGQCHNSPDEYIRVYHPTTPCNESCGPCRNAYMEKYKKNVSWGSSQVCECRVCQGMKKVMFNPETREVFPITLMKGVA